MLYCFVVRLFRYFVWTGSSESSDFPKHYIHDVSFGRHSHAWEVRNPVQFAAPVPYTLKKGVQVWHIVD